MSHFQNVCQHGHVHAQCRCPGPKSVKRITCDNMEHAKNPKRPEATVIPFPAPLIPDDVDEYINGPVDENPLTREIWETLIAGVVKDQAPNMAQALDWLHKQYGEWEN